METLSKQNSISSEKFSDIENQEMEFEFGSVTEPTSPKSPADHLFLNGRLLPHLFPVKNPNTITRSTSRASSISSKDSLISSRSGSTISRTSSCRSSARTSTSDEGSEHRRVFPKNKKIKTEKYQTALVEQYGGSSRPWQFIASAPVMNQGPKRKKRENVLREERKRTGGVCFCWRVLKWFVWVCEKCHAIEHPSFREDGMIP